MRFSMIIRLSILFCQFQMEKSTEKEIHTETLLQNEISDMHIII
jgi:hypothetical protein